VALPDPTPVAEMFKEAKGVWAKAFLVPFVIGGILSGISQAGGFHWPSCDGVDWSRLVACNETLPFLQAKYAFSLGGFVVAGAVIIGGVGFVLYLGLRFLGVFKSS